MRFSINETQKSTKAQEIPKSILKKNYSGEILPKNCDVHHDNYTRNKLNPKTTQFFVRVSITETAKLTETLKVSTAMLRKGHRTNMNLI